MATEKTKTPFFLIATALAVGAVGGYSAKTDTVRAGLSEPVQADGMTVLVKEQVDSAQALAALSYAKIAEEHGAKVEDINACETRQRLHLVWMPTTPKGDVCEVRAILQLDLPGTWIAGAPEKVK